MAAQPIFISHASKDDDFVKQLRVALESHGLTVWVDSRNAQLIDGKVIIEANNTEDMTQLLIEAGVRAEDIISGRKFRQRKAASVAA